jgi:hypothetical protein
LTPRALENEFENTDASRTARGPKRAPGRNALPESDATPVKSTSTFGTPEGSSCTGSRRKLAIAGLLTLLAGAGRKCSGSERAGARTDETRARARSLAEPARASRE